MFAMTVEGRREAALSYAERRLPVFPTGRDKRPLIPNGLLNASTNPYDIRAWWRRWPDANVAVRTGQPSGLVALDIDGDAGFDSLHDLERRHGELPDTASVVTPSGGQHFYFKWPGVPVKTTAGVIASGIDVRGDGGYALVPPSETDAGPYVRDSEAPVAAMPNWLVDATRDHPAGSRRPAVPPETWVTLLRDGIPGPREGAKGQRNCTLARLVGHLLSRNVDVDVAAELVHAVNQARCRPPMPADEVDRVIDSIARRELRQRQELWQQ
jgi:hypothetical protein